MKGYWKLETTGVEGELSESARAEVARLVQEGFTEGEIIDRGFKMVGLNKKEAIQAMCVHNQKVGNKKG